MSVVLAIVKLQHLNIVIIIDYLCHNCCSYQCIRLDAYYDFFTVEFTRKFEEAVIYIQMSRNVTLSLVMSY